MKTLLLSATALVLLSACSPRATTPEVSASFEAVCDAWQDSLPTRSKADTAQTIEEIGRGYDVFEAVCQRAAF